MNYCFITIIYTGLVLWSLLREQWQKNFCHVYQILAVKGVGGGVVWMNPLKSKICDENLFSDNVVWTSKNYRKIISADVKSNINDKKWKF